MCMLESNTNHAVNSVVNCMSFSTDMQCCSTRLDWMSKNSDFVHQVLYESISLQFISSLEGLNGVNWTTDNHPYFSLTNESY